MRHCRERRERIQIMEEALSEEASSGNRKKREKSD